MMVVRPNHYSSLQGFEAESIILPVRQRSPSIRIKTAPRSEEAGKASENASERMYDSATWRMYHRITNARRAKCYGATPQQQKQNSPNDAKGIPHHMGPAAQAEQQRLDSAPDYQDLQAEMFEMDL